ncbi:hypothetical protein GCM10027093_60700 [Paraburkholderia jirisanensis]
MSSYTKLIIVVCLSVNAVLPSCASAQARVANDPRDGSVSQTAQTAVAQVGGWQPETAARKTRAQVYEELVKAQQDGEIAYLNRTIYAHH